MQTRSRIFWHIVNCT